MTPANYQPPNFVDGTGQQAIAATFATKPVCVSARTRRPGRAGAAHRSRCCRWRCRNIKAGDIVSSSHTLKLRVRADVNQLDDGCGADDRPRAAEPGVACVCGCNAVDGPMVACAGHCGTVQHAACYAILDERRTDAAPTEAPAAGHRCIACDTTATQAQHGFHSLKPHERQSLALWRRTLAALRRDPTTPITAVQLSSRLSVEMSVARGLLNRLRTGGFVRPRPRSGAQPAASYEIVPARFTHSALRAAYGGSARARPTAAAATQPPPVTAHIFGGSRSVRPALRATYADGDRKRRTLASPMTIGGAAAARRGARA